MKKNIQFFITAFALLLSGMLFAQINTYTSSGSFTVPAGVTSLKVSVWGAGGGAGGGSAATGGGGGGGGAYSESTVTVIPGQIYPFIVGANGAGGSTGNGISGGDSSFSTTILAKGGIGGTRAGAGGQGGQLASGLGTIKYSGGNGGAGGANGGGGGGSSAGTATNGNNGFINTGSGGTAPVGGGAGGAGNSGNGTAGSIPGGGGGGSDDINNSLGAAGANGRVIITYSKGDLQVTKTVNNVVANVGSTVIFTVTAANLAGGSTVANISVQDLLPSGFTYTSHSVNAGVVGDYISGTGVWTISSLNSGASRVLTINATVNATGIRTNTATISAVSNEDTVSSNNSASVTVILPLDSDGDLIPDYQDLDNDNDGILDTVECTPPTEVKILAWMNATDNSATTYGTTFNVQAGNASSGGAGVTATVIGGANAFLKVTGAGEANYNAAVVNNDYVEYSFKTNSVYGVLKSVGYYNGNSVPANPETATNYNYATAISSNNFASNTLLHNTQTYTPGTGNVTYSAIADYNLNPNTTYKVRVYFYNVTGGAAASFITDDFKINAYKECDYDGDGIPNRLDLDSDNDGCSDSNEYYNNTTSAATGQQYGKTGGAVATVDGQGKVTAASYSSTTAGNVFAATNATITTQPVDKAPDAGTTTTFTVSATSLKATTFGGSPTFAPNFASGTTDNSANLKYQWQVSTNAGVLWTSLTNAGIYSGATTSTLTLTGVSTTLNNNQYRVLVTVSNNVCTSLTSNAAVLKVTVCYKPAVLDPGAGTTLGTEVGISALNRVGVASTWPKVRESGWIALEAKTKGFVINRVAFNIDNLPVVGATLVLTSPVEGMIVYDTTNNCLKVYTTTDGINFAWFCMETQACPE